MKKFLFCAALTISAFGSVQAVDVATKDELAAALDGTEPITIAEDLDLSGWTSVACSSGVSIDGANHTISGLTVPLLGAVTGDATIRNIVFSGAS